MNAEYAVSVVLVKTGPVMNVMNDLQRVAAANEDEAVGHAVRVSMERHPGHMVHCVTRLLISEVPNDEGVPRGHGNNAQSQ